MTFHSNLINNHKFDFFPSFAICYEKNIVIKYYEKNLSTVSILLTENVSKIDKIIKAMSNVKIIKTMSNLMTLSVKKGNVGSPIKIYI